MNQFQKPDGVVFSFRNLEALTLSKALCQVVSFIQNSNSHGLNLCKYADWWEHDGLHFSKGFVSLHDLFEMVKSPRALLAATPNEESVFVGSGPESGEWYLRFRLEWEDEGFQLEGGFDFISTVEWGMRFEQNVVSQLSLKPERLDSAAFYQRIIW